MLYIDTSVVVAYYCPEPLSGKAEKFLTGHSRPAISALTELELFSAVSRKVRDGGLDKADARRVTAKFLAHLDSTFFTYLSVEPRHYRLARDWIGLFTSNLKSLDALHLAVASSEGLALVTADQGLAKSAETLGLEAILLK